MNIELTQQEAELLKAIFSKISLEGTLARIMIGIWDKVIASENVSPPA